MRYEERDGKMYRVETLPEVKPRRRRKPMMPKTMQKGIAMVRQLRAGPPTDVPPRKKKRKKRPSSRVPVSPDALRALRDHFERR